MLRSEDFTRIAGLERRMVDVFLWTPSDAISAAMRRILGPPERQEEGAYAFAVPPPPPPPATIRETLARFRDLPRAEPMKIVMSSKHLDAVRLADAVREVMSSPPAFGNLAQIFALPIKIDETVSVPRLEPLHRRWKRSDVTTRMLLQHIKEHDTYAWEHLCRRFPAKVVLAAYNRDLDRGLLNFGVALRRAFLTDKGKNWLRDDPDGTA
jgi:hypothetical protein